MLKIAQFKGDQIKTEHFRYSFTQIFSIPAFTTFKGGVCHKDTHLNIDSVLILSNCFFTESKSKLHD